MQLNNGARLASYNSHIVLRMTDGSAAEENTTAYFRIAQPVNQGFSTYFSFQMHQPTLCCAPGDGFAFIIQNSTATDSSQGASGHGLYAVGSEDGGVGYSGINNSLAVEFDILQDPWDPNGNHIAIQTCGGDLSLYNSPVHLPGTYTIGDNDDVTSCLLSQGAINTDVSALGPTCSEDGCTDGAPHQVVIEYTPPTSQQQGSLQVFLDPEFEPNSQVPVPGSVPAINVPYNLVYSLSNPLGLALSNTSQLLVGFTGSQPAEQGTTIDVMAWEFTTHSPTQITQIIPPGGQEADYSFGAHQAGITYPQGFQNPGNITMTVLETPVNQQIFHDTRLAGTQFANENCIIYQQTGGNCVVYSVTCHDQNGNQVMCPTEEEDNIAICTQFQTSEPVASPQADFLKADPIGSNNWCSIFVSYDQNQDPVTTGKGRGFSDLVATFSPTGPGPACTDLRSITRSMKRTIERSTRIQRQQDGGSFCPPIMD